MFVFQLAERLGMTAKELGERMTSTEYTYWVGLENLRYRAAKKAEAQANAKRGRF